MRDDNTKLTLQSRALKLSRYLRANLAKYPILESVRNGAESLSALDGTSIFRCRDTANI